MSLKITIYGSMGTKEKLLFLEENADNLWLLNL